MEVAQGHIRPHQSKLSFIVRLTDGALIMASLMASILIYGVATINESYVMVAFIAMGAYVLFADGLNVYSSLRTSSLRDTIFPILMDWFLVVFILFALAYFSKTSTEYSRLTLGMWMLLAPATLIAFRLVLVGVLSQARKRGFNTRSVAIVGAEPHGNKLANTIIQTPSLGLNLMGFFENRQQSDRTGEDLVVPIVGNFDDLLVRAKKGEIDLVYLALSLKGQDRITAIIEQLKDTTASVHLVPDFFAYDLLHSRWANVGDMPTISISESPFMSVSGWLKRTEDIILSSLILLIIAIPMLIIGLGVKLTSPGPAIFKQRRYGLDGKAINVWKFRSMTTCDNGDTIVQATANDMRVTKFGAFLRRTSLDELPQFINVLMGDMSVVGPRPHAVAHNEEYRKLISGYMLRHKVPPGITGWAQINGWRGETDTLEKMEMRVEYDLWYIRSWSVWLDIKIVFGTIFKGFVGKNAY